MEIGSEKLRQLWLNHLKKHYKFTYTTTGFGWVKKKD